MGAVMASLARMYRRVRRAVSSSSAADGLSSWPLPLKTVVHRVAHMKTTIDIADALLARAKAQAASEETTLKALTEEGLQMVLKERAKRKGKRIEPVTVSGGGLQPEYADADWNRIRAAAYEGTGA